MLNEFFNGSTGAAASYDIERSLRFNPADSSYLSRTPSSVGNRRTWTLSFWVKRSKLGTPQAIFNGNPSVNPYVMIAFNSDDKFDIGIVGASYRYITEAVFRDTSAWYHFVLACDTTNPTAGDRIKVWVNGVQQAFEAGTLVQVPQDFQTEVNNTTEHRIGRWLSTSNNYQDGYFADYQLIDGTAAPYTDFGGYDANGVWQPKAYDGAYGVNGFRLDFSNGATAALLGTDSSGNGNDWDVFNMTPLGQVSPESDEIVATGTTDWGTYADGVSLGGYSTNVYTVGTAANMFDGNENNYYLAGSNDNTNWQMSMRVVFPIPITGNLRVKTRTNNGTRSELSVTGQPAQAPPYNSDTWSDFGYCENVTQIQHLVRWAVTGNKDFGISAIEFDGVILTGSPQKAVVQVDTDTNLEKFFISDIVEQRPTTFPKTSTILSAVDSPIWKIVDWRMGDVNQTGSLYVPTVLEYQGSPTVQPQADGYFQDNSFSNPGWGGDHANGYYLYADFNNSRTGYTIDCSSSSGGLVNEVSFSSPGSGTYRGVPQGNYTEYNISNYIGSCNNVTNGLMRSIQGQQGYVTWNAFYWGNASKTVMRRIYHSSQTPTVGNGGLGTLLTFVDNTNFEYFNIGDTIAPGITIIDIDRNNSTFLIQNTSSFVPGGTVSAPNSVTISGSIESIDLGLKQVVILPTNSYPWGPANQGYYLLGPSTFSSTPDVDSLFDSPTNGTQTDAGAGGEVSGNYCTLNPLDHERTGSAPTNGNLEISGDSSCKGTFGFPSGNWYFEFAVTGFGGTPYVGVATADTTGSLSSGSSYFLYRGSDGQKQTTSGTSSYGASYGDGDVIGVAFDADTPQVTFYKNNVSQGAIPVTSGYTYFPQVIQSSSTTYTVNFGQRAFTYTAPSGYKALCTANLADPTIADGSSYFTAVEYAGNSGDGLPTTQDITTTFSPDLVWIKDRTGTNSHHLFDTVRGAGKRIFSNSTAAETDVISTLSAFNPDGFTVNGNNAVNDVGRNYISWNWDAGTSTVSNTDGSITSQVRANPSAGFSIVSYTGTGTAGTVGHGLNAEPFLIISKNRNDGNAVGGQWYTYHKSLGNSTQIQLQSTDAAGSGSSFMDNTTPTSSVFARGSFTAVNGSGDDLIAYCWAPVEGYSAFGSYTGNGSADGPFVYTGFRPRWMMIKAVNATSNPSLDAWVMYDSERDTYNVVTQYLYANSSQAEQSYGIPDFCSNGFKIRVGSTESNESGNTYIYACFAENPLKIARAR